MTNLWHWSGKAGVPLLSALLLATLGRENVVRAGDFALSNSPPESTTTARLEYQETGYTVNNARVSLSTRAAVFKKEPAAVSGRVFRGVLNFGGGASNAIPFLWQREAGKLFLDLNRNQDLTDDAAGVFSARLTRPLNYQTFTNVHLVANTPSGRCPVLADISFWDSGASPGVTVELRSFWQGRATLAGQDWQVGVIPDLAKQADSCEGAQLLLRSWEKRDQPFNAAGNSFDAFPFSQKLFVGGHAYELKSLPGSQSGEFKPSLQFVEQAVTLGDLKITGKYIRRLMLAGNTYLAIFDQPAATVKMPVGGYFPSNVLLEQGGVEAFGNSVQWQPQKKFSVDEKAPAILAVGGPLTNSVAVTRHGQDLRLDYRLIGAGGQTYQMASVNRSQPPEFAIYKGDKKIASGNFEFG